MEDGPKRSLMERLSSMLLREPEDRDQLVALLHGALENELLDADALTMIEGVMQVSEMQVRDVMIPRSQMDMIDVEDEPNQFIPSVIETATPVSRCFKIHATMSSVFCWQKICCAITQIPTNLMCAICYDRRCLFPSRND